MPLYVMPLQRCCTMQRGVPLTEDRIVISIWFGARQTCAPPLWNHILLVFPNSYYVQRAHAFSFRRSYLQCACLQGEATFFHERLVPLCNLFEPQSHRVSYFCTKGVSNRVRIMDTNINSNITILQTGHVFFKGECN
jgi:hypothetical protein